ncbi:hypothetical protein VTJ04DRAFT_1522 [Mycothermus thermophilus]|uniref:uncharacterized protein n=1 Tax=Humicola insolens TaxID=85995 RepID=UPI003744ADB7
MVRDVQSPVAACGNDQQRWDVFRTLLPPRSCQPLNELQTPWGILEKSSLSDSNLGVLSFHRNSPVVCREEIESTYAWICRDMVDSLLHPTKNRSKCRAFLFFVLFRLGMEGEKRELTWLVRKIRSGLVVRGHVKSPGTASAATAMMRLLMPAEVKTERKKQLGSQRNSTLMPCRQTIPCESESAKCMQSFVFQVVYFKHALKRSKQWKTNRASRGG